MLLLGSLTLQSVLFTLHFITISSYLFETHRNDFPLHIGPTLKKLYMFSPHLVFVEVRV